MNVNFSSKISPFGVSTLTEYNNPTATRMALASRKQDGLFVHHELTRCRDNLQYMLGLHVRQVDGDDSCGGCRYTSSEPYNLEEYGLVFFTRAESKIPFMMEELNKMADFVGTPHFEVENIGHFEKYKGDLYLVTGDAWWNNPIAFSIVSLSMRASLSAGRSTYSILSLIGPRGGMSLDTSDAVNDYIEQMLYSIRLEGFDKGGLIKFLLSNKDIIEEFTEEVVEQDNPVFSLGVSNLIAQMNNTYYGNDDENRIRFMTYSGKHESIHHFEQRYKESVNA